MTVVVRTQLLKAIVELLEFHRKPHVHLPVTEAMLWDALKCALAEDGHRADAVRAEARELQNADAYEQ